MNMETIFMNTENGKINGLHKFISEKKKNVILKKLFIYYMLKSLRKQYKNNKLKKIALAWNNEL